jgi:hypothetical protein
MAFKSIITTRSKKKLGEQLADSPSIENLARAFENATLSIVNNEQKKRYLEFLNINYNRPHTQHCIIRFRLTGQRGCCFGWENWSYEQINSYAASNCSYENPDYAKYSDNFLMN